MKALTHANICLGHLTALLLLTLLTLAAHTARAQYSVVDDRGIANHWSTPPERVITLLPSLTETVCALGECARLVGVDRYSNWPTSVMALPELGGGMDPNIEAIVALAPDVIFTAQSSRGAQKLEDLGLKVVALEPKSHADAKRVLEKIAQTLGLNPERAQQLWLTTEQAVAATARTLPASTHTLRVYIEVNRAPFGAGPTSFIGETLTRLGAQNILPTSLGPFPRVNPEFVVRAQPTVIMISKRDLPEMLLRPGWAAMQAIKENRVCAFASAEQDVLVRPGPRLAEAATLMATCLKRFAP